MKKRLLSLLCALSLLAALVVPAAAADSNAIQVQLNGENLSFTDAVPTAKDGRTYLPFRTVFEALGAKVDYDSAAGTVTAVRDGKSLTMKLGSTTATVEEKGVASTLVMDAAPYAEKNRTYVPIRFAAQAFGCTVGWDGAKRTAVLMDTGKLLDEAMAGHSFTVMEKMMAYSQKQSMGTLAADGKMTMAVNGMGSKLLTGDIAFNGITSDNDAVQMNMDIKLDMTGLMALMASMTGETLQASEAELKPNIKMDFRGKLSDGKLYFLMSGIPDMQEGVWLMMDMNKALEQSGMGLDFASLLDLSKQMDLKALLSLGLATTPVDSISAYTELADSLKGIAALLSDTAFQKTAEGYSNTITHSANGASFHIAITLPTNASGEVIGVGMVMDATVTDPTLAEQGMDSITIHMTSTQKGEKSSFQMTLGAGTLFDARIKGDITMTPTTKTPEVTPPAGATVVDLFETAGLSF